MVRLNAKVATAGKAGLYRFPSAKASIDERLTSDGRFDEGKARAALQTEQIQIGQKDDKRVIAFTMEYLEAQEAVVRHMTEKLNSSGSCVAAVTDAKGYRTTAATMGDRHCESRMDKGRNVYVRTDITGCSDGIHVKLSTGNPHGVVGHSEEFAHDCAIMLARILISLRESITTTKLTLIEGAGAEAYSPRRQNWTGATASRSVARPANACTTATAPRANSTARCTATANARIH